MQQIVNLKQQPNEILISHDVVSLFTKTPIEEALKVIKEKLQKDVTLQSRTKLKVEDIMDLLQFVLTTTYFSFGGKLYQQKFGAAMEVPCHQ